MPQAADRAAAAIYQTSRFTPKLQLMPSLRGIGASSTATALLPVGLTYHALLFRFTIAGVEATAAQILAQVTRIKCTLDGDPKVDASAAELAMRERHWNTRNAVDPVNSGILPLWLARIGAQEIDSQDGPSWGTSDRASFNVDVTMGAGATIDGIEIRAWVTKGTPLGRHLTLRRITDNMPNAGDKVLSDFNNPNVELQLVAIHIDKSAGQGNLITAVNLKADQVEEWDGPYAHVQNLFTAYGLTQVSGYTHLPFAMRGRTLDSLPLVMSDMRLKLTCSAALNNFNVLMERIEGVEG